MLRMPVFKLVLKVPYSRLQPYPPEDNELTNWGRMTHICVILHLEAAVYLARTNCIIEPEDISLRPGTYRTFWLGCTPRLIKYNDVMKSKLFPRYWPFVQGIHRSPVNSPHKGQWRGALIFSLIWAWINEWVNNREAGDLRRHRAHYDVHVMICDAFHKISLILFRVRFLPMTEQGLKRANEKKHCICNVLAIGWYLVHHR